jgi:uncharacterized membrane protein
MSRVYSRRRESAQVIVLFALGLLGFLAMLGLVIDGGTLYVQRRTAQRSSRRALSAMPFVRTCWQMRSG